VTRHPCRVVITTAAGQLLPTVVMPAAAALHRFNALVTGRCCDLPHGARITLVDETVWGAVSHAAR
jgi:hypothetical protein